MVAVKLSLTVGHAVEYSVLAIIIPVGHAVEYSVLAIVSRTCC